MDKWKELKKDLKEEIKINKNLGGGKAVTQEVIKHDERILNLMDVIEKEESGYYDRKNI